LLIVCPGRDSRRAYVGAAGERCVTIPEQTAAIKDRYEDYWRSADALKEAMAAWGAEG